MTCTSATRPRPRPSTLSNPDRCNGLLGGALLSIHPTNANSRRDTKKRRNGGQNAPKDDVYRPHCEFVVVRVKTGTHVAKHEFFYQKPHNHACRDPNVYSPYGAPCGRSPVRRIECADPPTGNRAHQEEQDADSHQPDGSIKIPQLRDVHGLIDAVEEHCRHTPANGPETEWVLIFQFQYFHGDPVNVCMPSAA